MKYADCWVVKSETSGKIYGPFSSAHVAAKWAVASVDKNSHWVLVRIRSR